MRGVVSRSVCRGGRPRITPMRLAVLGVALFGLCFPSTAGAEVQTHVFDPVLSLTGGCTTNKLDPVADPGCPTEHAPNPFSQPSGVAVDLHGDIYVANIGNNSGSEGRVDVFDPSGHFITEFKTEPFPETIAVDTQCNVYVKQFEERTLRYTPSSCPPSELTTYGELTWLSGSQGGIAVNSSNDHLFVRRGESISEYSPTGELIDSTIGQGALFTGRSSTIAVYGATGDIYTSTTKTADKQVPSEEEPFVSIVKVFGSGPGHPLKYTIDGSDTPEGGFRADFGKLGLAVDEANGDLYVNDVEGSGFVYQFRLNEAGEYEFISKISHSFQDVAQAIAFDNGPSSPNQGHLFVTSHPQNVGHLFAFEPAPEEAAPIVEGESFSGLSTTEALLEGEVNPNGAATGYRFEYVDEATFQSDVAESGAGHGFDHATRAPVPGAQLPASNAAVPVSEAITGLQPGTKYHFRVFAENAKGIAEGERKGGEEVEHVFATYPPASPGLPDSRAYELVTPPDTNGRLPTATGIGIGDGFETNLVTALGPNGDTNLLYETVGGSLPGTEGTGAINGDVYEAERGPAGWSSSIAEPSGAQSQAPSSGGFSPDHLYSFWNTAGGGVHDNGSLVIGGEETHYTRMPDGSFELIGKGAGGEEDPLARGRRISAGATHLILTSPVQLEPDAPPTPVSRPSPDFGTVYDRGPGGTVRVLSLLPGDITPASAGEIAYQGTSADGSAVAFKVGSTLYERRSGETLIVEEGNPTFTGISGDGGRVFFLKGGNIFAFDAGEGTTIPVGSGGESTVVNISADGSHVYFVSTKRLGGQGKSGKDNLYVWNDGTIAFIGTLEHIDVTGKDEGVSGFLVGGLGLWTQYGPTNMGTNGGPANDPSRTTANGRFLVFQSRAELTGYDSEGHPEIYRYDSNDGSLLCVSCNPTLAPVVSGGKLQSLSASGNQFAPGNSLAPTANLTEDGQVVFFETEDALVAGDVDQTQDVYEWEAEGTDGCTRASGCFSLISSGHSAEANYLYAAGRDGNDVFFRTGDQLLRADQDATPSIYDARVGGGFAETQAPACQGEACRGAVSSPPDLPDIASTGMSDLGARKHCPKGERRVFSRGKSRCVKAHHKGRHRHKHHSRSSQ
jgi:hypothetical protein